MKKLIAAAVAALYLFGTTAPVFAAEMKDDKAKKEAKKKDGKKKDGKKKKKSDK